MTARPRAAPPCTLDPTITQRSVCLNKHLERSDSHLLDGRNVKKQTETKHHTPLVDFARMICQSCRRLLSSIKRPALRSSASLNLRPTSCRLVTGTLA